MVTVKNIDSIARTWGGMVLSPEQSFSPSNSESLLLANDPSFLAAISSSDAEVAKNGFVLNVSNSVIELLGRNISVVSTPPFSEPTHRTKRTASASWVTCPEGSETQIDFVLSEERYATGGEVIFHGAKKGDYIEASVYDIYSYIPEADRASLCENHPTVAKYIEKKWIKPSDGFDSFLIDTYPLNAKIPAGMSLRITYHAAAEAGDRSVAVNYHLTKKI